MDIFRENGYTDRDDYLEALADVYGADLDSVLALADMLGENEDFDGLISALNDLM